jgi:hypothetical protein
MALRSSSRRTKVTVAGAAGLGVALTASLAAFVTLVPARSGDAPKAVAVNVLGGRPATSPEAVASQRHPHPARHGDLAALAFYAARDPARARHVTEVVWTGPMLRVYTNLPASDADSKTATALCQAAAAYAQAHDRIPAVFVHADRAAGYPVLANKMGPRDDCRLDRVP